MCAVAAKAAAGFIGGEKGKMSEGAVFLIGWCIFFALWIRICTRRDKELLKAEEEWRKEEIERYGDE